MYSNTRIKKMIDKVDGLTVENIDSGKDLAVLKDDLIKADLVIKDLTSKIAELIIKVDKLAKSK